MNRWLSVLTRGITDETAHLLKKYSLRASPYTRHRRANLEVELKRYHEKQEAIRQLFEYEESQNLPESERLTHDPYANEPAILEPSPRKKAYVDIRGIESIVRNLKHKGEL